MDGWLERWFADHRSDWADHGAKVLANVGTSTVLQLVILTGLVIYAVRTRRWQPPVAVVGAAAVAAVAAMVCKVAIARPRPRMIRWLVDAEGSSMPSSVAALTAAVALALVLAVPRCRFGLRVVVALVGVLLSLLAGASVIYVGVHWPTDVLAGWGLGIAAAVGVTAAVRLVDERIVRPRHPAWATPVEQPS